MKYITRKQQAFTELCKVSDQKGYLSITLPNPKSLCRKNTPGAEEILTLLGVLQF